MATTSSIGTSSRDYSTIASWLAAFTTGGWIGECYNDSQFTAGCNFTGHSTSAANYITLTTASGQSYRDNASVQTNLFSFVAANGVSVSQNTAYGKVFNINEDYVTISNLQVAQVHVSGDYIIANNLSSSSNCILENLILEQQSTTKGCQMRQGLVRNCLLILRNASGQDGWYGPYGSAKYVNVTTVRPSNFAAGGRAFFDTNGQTITNCAAFGFTTFSTGTPSAGSNNCSDVAIGFGSSNQASKTYANQFVTTTDTSRDFKLKTGADCYDTAVTDTTNIPAAIDAVGTSRPQSSAWDIGAWELVASAPPATTHQFRILLGAG